MRGGRQGRALSPFGKLGLGHGEGGHYIFATDTERGVVRASMGVLQVRVLEGGRASSVDLSILSPEGSGFRRVPASGPGVKHSLSGHSGLLAKC